jgi:hypothetical protein
MRLHGQNNFDNNTTIVSAAAENNYDQFEQRFQSSVSVVVSPMVVNEARFQIATDKRLEDRIPTPQSTISDFGQLGGDTARPPLFEARRIESPTTLP